MKLLCTTVFILATATTSFAEVLKVGYDILNNPFPKFETIQDAVDASSNGDEIIVFAGTYIADGMDYVVDISKKSLYLSSYYGPEKTIIDGENTFGGIASFVNNGYNSTIEGFSILNCSTPLNSTGGSGLYITGDLQVEGCIISQCVGGAVSCLDGQPTFSNCDFISNLAPGNSDVVGSGGAVYCSDSQPTFSNCKFAYNSASGSGGAVYCSDSQPTFSSCDFVSNSASGSGGAVYCSDSQPTFSICDFVSNSALDRGGAFRGYSVTGYFQNCMFTSNSASRGGAVNVVYDFTSTGSSFVECDFVGNEASSLGGAVENNSTNSSFLLCNFEGNSSSGLGGGQGNGGAMFNDSSSVAISNSNFILNTANSKGGGIYNWSSEPNIVNCQFQMNSAANGGGINSLNGVGPVLSTSNFCENEPNNISGPYTDDNTNCLAALCTDVNENGIADECEDNIWTVDDDGPADFDNIQSAINASSNGFQIIVMPGTYSGGLVLDGSLDSIWIKSNADRSETIIDGEGLLLGFNIEQATSETVIEGFTITNCVGGMRNIESNTTVIDCLFINNNNNSYGAGMYNYLSMPTISNCIFESNAAVINGGGMHNLSSEPTVINCTFLNNTAFTGAGVCNSECGPLMTFENCSFQFNNADALEGRAGGMYNSLSQPLLTNCIFEYNTAGDGGGMYNQLCALEPEGVRVLDSTFRLNSVNNGDYGFGGGIYSTTGALSLSNCIFTDNSANTGGGIYGLLTISFLNNCSFEGNSATSEGGGIYHNKVPLYLTECNFQANLASEGGGLCNSVGQSILEGCTFNGNTSSIVGGAISNSNLLQANNCLFSGNSSMSLDLSSNFGGAIYNDDEAAISNCEFRDNSSGYGGGLFTGIGAETIINNSLVKRNIAKVCGGGSFNLQGIVVSENTTYCANLPDQLVGGWVDDGGNELSESCIPDVPGFCRSDCNQDYNVDVLDLLYLLAVWDTDNPAGDINTDGWVNINDLLLLISDWGTCP